MSRAALGALLGGADLGAAAGRWDPHPRVEALLAGLAWPVIDVSVLADPLAGTALGSGQMAIAADTRAATPAPAARPVRAAVVKTLRTPAPVAAAPRPARVAGPLRSARRAAARTPANLGPRPGRDAAARLAGGAALARDRDGATGARREPPATRDRRAASVAAVGRALDGVVPGPLDRVIVTRRDDAGGVAPRLLDRSAAVSGAGGSVGRTRREGGAAAAARLRLDGAPVPASPPAAARLDPHADAGRSGAAAHDGTAPRRARASLARPADPGRVAPRTPDGAPTAPPDRGAGAAPAADPPPALERLVRAADAVERACARLEAPADVEWMPDDDELAGRLGRVLARQARAQGIGLS